MKISLDGLEVIFPYEFIYPEQYEYMRSIYHCIREKGHGALEMPSGTGKTVSILALVLSYQLAYPDKHIKLIYCTRTVGEMEKCLQEMKELLEYRKKYYSENINYLGIGLSSRKNLCCNDDVRSKNTGVQVDTSCRSKTVSWARDRVHQKKEEVLKEGIGDIEDLDKSLCSFFEKLDLSKEGDDILPPGCYTLEDLYKYGKEKGLCPYFLARRAMEYSNLIVYSYLYLLDPKIASLISNQLAKDAIVIFDEAHNIDSVCLESLSITLSKNCITGAERNMKELQNRVKEMEGRNSQRLHDEYKRMLKGLEFAGTGTLDRLTANPALPQDILTEAVPGNIRKARNFVVFLRRFCAFLLQQIGTKGAVIMDPNQFLKQVQYQTSLTPRELRFTSERLYSLMNTLEIKNVDQFFMIKIIGDFATLIGTYQDGFQIIIEPTDDRTPTVPEPTIQYCCLDASIAIKNVFNRFQTVIITSGTLSPLSFYTKLLDFQPVVCRSFKNTLTRNCICPLIISRGNDQVVISSNYKVRKTKAVMRNFGLLLEEMTKTTPDGIVCFFTSYQYMEDVIDEWNRMYILDRIRENKLLYVETHNREDTSQALSNFRAACDCGRGAVFLAYARGKVAEGIDFDGHYGRTVIMFGVPRVNPKARSHKCRMQYLEKKGINQNDFEIFDAMRNSAQCIGRVIRHKRDYGVMILADKRYNLTNHYTNLPDWISEHITPQHMNLSTDSARNAVQRFFTQMAQPIDEKSVLEKTLYTEQDILRLELELEGKKEETVDEDLSESDESKKRKTEENGQASKRRKVSEIL